MIVFVSKLFLSLDLNRMYCIFIFNLNTYIRFLNNFINIMVQLLYLKVWCTFLWLKCEKSRQAVRVRKGRLGSSHHQTKRETRVNWIQIHTPNMIKALRMPCPFPSFYGLLEFHAMLFKLDHSLYQSRRQFIKFDRLK